MPVLVEYQPTLVTLDRSDLAFLLDMVRASTSSDDDARVLESLTPTATPGAYMVRSGPFIGRLGLPSGRFLDFRSRFDFLDVLELVRLSARLPVRRDRFRVPSSEGAALVDIVACAYAGELERLIGQGLAKGYVEVRFRDPPYPGSLDINRHLAQHGGRSDRLVTRARRITHDIAINQALLAALDVLRRVPLHPEIELRLARVRPAFGSVRPLPIGADAIASITLTALTSRYRDALGLAELILRSQSLVPTGVDHRGIAILFSMPKVWERYVYLAAQQSWPTHHVVHGHPFRISPGGLRAEADVVVLHDEEIVALYDAKYKRLEDAPTRADLYQMVAYCERLGLTECGLVLPALQPCHRSVRVGTRIIHTLGLPSPQHVDALPRLPTPPRRSPLPAGIAATANSDR